MIIGLDLDGTITDLDEFFSVVTRALCDAGHEIHIITYRDSRAGAEEDLNAYKITYTKLHLPPDGISAPAWKKKLAEELALDLLIDDSPEVLHALPSSTKRLWVCDQEIFDLGKAIKAMTR